MLTVLHDLHIGAIRNAGTTPATQLALRKQNLVEFQALLPESDLMILGDLFDTYNIPIVDVLTTYFHLKAWLEKGHQLYLVAGNHDLSKTSDVMSSFDFLCSLLLDTAPACVTVIKGEGQLIPWGYVIPHVANQDLFNYELSKVPTCAYLYLHCNYDNHFAAQSDQSLNLSKEQADSCLADKIVIAHEHHYRQSGKVILPGCQITSSVSDWLSDTNKYYATISGEGLQLVQCKEKDDYFIDLDWKAVELVDKPYIRVSGYATPEEATKVVNMVGKLRKLSSAYVVSNAVQILSADGVAEAFSRSLEDVTTFKVREALFKLLSPPEIATIEGLK